MPGGSHYCNFNIFEGSQGSSGLDGAQAVKLKVYTNLALANTNSIHDPNQLSSNVGQWEIVCNNISDRVVYTSSGFLLQLSKMAVCISSQSCVQFNCPCTTTAVCIYNKPL